MKIRNYRANTDYQQVRDCVITLQDFERKIDPRMPTGQSIADEYMVDMFKQCDKYTGQIFVVEDEGKIYGYITLHTRHVSDDIDDGPREYGFISDVFVSEQVRGQGVGKALLDHAENFARSKQVKELMLGVLAANKAAKSLYLENGYEEFAITLEKKL